VGTTVEVTWPEDLTQFRLQQHFGMEGDWLDVSGVASSRFSEPMTGSKRLFCLKSQCWAH
jgi:hypothetical protein